MEKRRVDIITMGCSKNLVDSEQLISLFEANGFDVEHDAAEPKGNIAVINTCGFIGDAKEESINMILDFAALRKSGDLDKLFVMGCLSERYKEDLAKEIPEVDKYFGKFDWSAVIDELVEKPVRKSVKRTLTTPSHYAYLKISEGCNRACSYCAIPLMTGKHKSRPIEEIVAETALLANQGVKELQIIAQDLSFYGLDLYNKNRLADLISSLADVKGIEWIRLHYMYPAGFPTDLLAVIRERENVCLYLDMALQHISDNMLKLMRRNVTKQQTYDLLAKIRKEVPGIHLRTTLLTGHPGETAADFEELKQFVKDIKFDRLGVFPYSEEDGTYAGDNYTDDIPDEVKQDRTDELMAIQEEISLELHTAKIGMALKVIIDRKEDDYWIGRTEFDSPEVDPEVLVTSEKELQIGQFYMVTIMSAEPYDLHGIV